ncbi:hypothetical protein L593_08735 [Salinarchaeum sp. Harcht-Bsk1]|nr:hypothetical protein L593_08735 [Salinarchaeum sp. Harcht-Bsk1]
MDGAYPADRASVQVQSGQSRRPWQLIVAVPHRGQSSAPGVTASTLEVVGAVAGDDSEGAFGPAPGRVWSVVGIHTNGPHFH